MRVCKFTGTGTFGCFLSNSSNVSNVFANRFTNFTNFVQVMAVKTRTFYASHSSYC